MTYTFIVFGVLSVLLYLLVCLKERTYANALTPYVAFYFTTAFVLEPIYYFSTDIPYDLTAFNFVYLCDFCYLAGLTIAYLSVMSKNQDGTPVDIKTRDSAHAWMFSWILLSASVLLFLPVALEFGDIVLSDPRHLYELTRSGYGQYLFISTLLLNLAIIVFLFSSRRGAIFFVPAVLFLSLLKGAKGPILVVGEILLLWLVYARQWRVGLRTFAICVTVFAVMMGSLFLATLKGVEPRDLIVGIAGYSDYNRNAALTVTEPVGPKFGQLSWEALFYSRIPRFLIPDKPKNFGVYYLAEHYRPEQFDAGLGAPAFGVGLYIADYAVLAPFMLLVGGLINGYFLARCLNWLRSGGGLAAFVTFLYFANVSLIPIPTAFLGLEHLLIGLAVANLIRLRYLHIRLRQPT